MIEQVSRQKKGADDPFKLYASPVGVGFLQKANKIYEDFPTCKYVLFFFIFTIEVALAFGFGWYINR